MIWIISGTQDGREIGARLADWMQKQPEDHRADILMTVVSQYGKILAEHEGITIEVGRFAREDMLREVREKHITCILDCSHPYAAIVSETARAACKEAGIAYVRYERPGIALPAYDKLHLASHEEEAAALAGWETASCSRPVRRHCPFSSMQKPCRARRSGRGCCPCPQ